MRYTIPADPAARTPYQANLAAVRDRIITRSDGTLTTDEYGAIVPCSRDDDPSEHDRPRGGWLARVADRTLPPSAHGAMAYAR